MKKLFLASVFILLASISHAKVVIVNTPTSATNSSVTISSSVIAAATAGRMNCINNATLMSTTVSNMVIIDGALNGGTTLWQLINAPASTPVYPIGISIAPLIGGGEVNALCGSPNSPLVVAISTGTKSINYNSFVRE